MKIISLRLSGQKQELEELGEQTQGMITTVSKLQNGIMNATKVASNGMTGINIEDTNGNLKSTYQILSQIANIWDEIGANDKLNGTNQQQYLLETMAGKNRSNILASLLQSPETLNKAYRQAQDAQGSAEIENQKYKQSIQGRMKEFTNQAQELASTLLQSDLVKFFVDFGSGVVDTINDITTALGGVGTALATLGSISLIKGLLKGNAISKQLMAIENAAPKVESVLGNIANNVLGPASSGRTLTDALRVQVNSAASQAVAFINASGKFSPQQLQNMVAGFKASGDAAHMAYAQAIELRYGLNAASASAGTASLSFSTLGKAIKTAFLSNPIGMGIALFSVAFAAISRVTNAFKELKQEQIKSASDSAQAYKDSSGTIQQSIDKYSELQETLRSGRATQQQAAQAKSNLLDIQKKLSQEYGKQAQGIDLVNGSYEEQIKKMRKLNKQKAHEELLKNSATGSDEGNFATAVEQMQRIHDKDSEYLLGTFDSGLQMSDNLINFLKQYKNVQFQDIGDGVISAYATGTAEQIYDTMSEMTKQLKGKDWYDPNQESIKALQVWAGRYAKEANQTISDYKETYDKYLQMSLMDSSQKIDLGDKSLYLGDYFYDYVDAIQAYNNALEKGQSDEIIQKAKEKVEEYKKAWDEVQDDSSFSKYNRIIEGLGDLIDKTKDKAFDLKTALTSPDSGLDKIFKTNVDNLKKDNGEIMDVTDFISGALGNKEVKYHKQAFLTVASAINQGWISDDTQQSVTWLANMLAQLGYLSNDTASGFDSAASSLKGFLSAAASSDPQKKLGDITDDIQSIYSSLTDARKKFEQGNFGETELLDLLQQFPELAQNEAFLQSVTDELDPSGFIKYTDQIQGALSGVIFENAIKGIADLDSEIQTQQKQLARMTNKSQIQAQKSAIAQMKAFRNTLVDSLDFSDISGQYVDKAIKEMSISGTQAEKGQLRSWLQSQVAIGNGEVVARLILDESSATWGFTTWKKNVEAQIIRARVQIDPETIQKNVTSIQNALSDNSTLSQAISNSISGEFNTDSILEILNKFPLLTNNTQAFRDVINSLDAQGIVHDTQALSSFVSGLSVENFEKIDSYFNKLEMQAPQLESALEALRKNIIGQADLSGVTADQLFGSKAWDNLSEDTKKFLTNMIEDGYDVEAIAKVVLKGDVDPSLLVNQIVKQIENISERRYKASIQVITDFRSDISSIESVQQSISNGQVTSDDLLSISSSMKEVSDAAYQMGVSVADMDMDGFSDDINKWSKALSKAKFDRLREFLSNSNVSNAEKLSAILNTDFGNIANAEDFIRDPMLNKMMRGGRDSQIAFKVQLAIDATKQRQTKEQIIDMFNNFQVAINLKMTEQSMKQFTANIQAMQSAIDEQYSSGNITTETLQSLTDAGINYSGMLQANANGLALNTQEAIKYTQNLNQMKLTQSRVLQQMKQADLENTQKKIQGLVGSVEDTDNALRKLDAGEAISQIQEFNSLSPTQLEDITDLTNTRSELQSAIEKQKELQIQILASMGLLAEMDAAASSVNPRDSLIGTLSGREQAEKTYKQGWLGDDYLGAYAQYYAGRGKTREQALDEWEQNIEKWKPYEEYDEDNNLKATSILKFLDESANMTANGTDTGIFRDQQGNIQVQVDDIRQLASAWGTSQEHVLQYIQAAQDLAPGKQFDISAMMQSWIDDMGNWDGSIDGARQNLSSFLETAQYLHKLDPSMDLTSLYSNVSDAVKGMQGQQGVQDLVSLVNSFSELSGITLTIQQDGTITQTVNQLTQIKSIMAQLEADHAIGATIDENDERVKRLVEQYSQSELQKAGFVASDAQKGITAADIAAQFSTIMEQQDPVDKSSVSQIISAISQLPSQIGESVASAIKQDSNLADKEREENISNTNDKNAPQPFDFSQYKPFDIEKMAQEKFGQKQSINKELEENQDYSWVKEPEKAPEFQIPDYASSLKDAPIQTDSVTVQSSNMQIPQMSEQLISKKLEENSDYSYVQEPEKTPQFKIPDYINTLKDTSIQANSVTVESGDIQIPQIQPFGGVAIQQSYKTGSADTSQTPGQVAATATITGVNTSTDIVVPVTGQMDTVQNEVSQKPEVQVQGVLSQINQGDATPTVQANVQTSGGDQIQQLKQQASGDVSIKSSVTGNATGRLEDIKKAKDEIQRNSTANITSNVSGNAESTTSSILSNIQRIQSLGNVQNTITTRKIQITEKRSSGGTGPAIGTMYAPAHANGAVGLANNQNALVNQEGTESVVRNGRWFQLPGGPHIEQLKRGDIVFSKKQTEQLKKTGKTNGHGSTIGLSAHSSGTVPGMPAHGANPYNVLKQSVSGTVTAAQQKAVNKATGNTQSTAANTEATNDNTNSKKSNTNATDKNTKKKEEEGTVVDWVAKRLDYLGNIVSNLASKITDYISYAFRQNTLDQQLAALQKQIGDTAAGIARYNKAASEITILDNDGVSVELYPVNGKSGNKTKKTTKKKKKKSKAIGGRIFSGGKALVNEQGMESRSRNGVWELLQGGPHFEDVRPDDIIFTADQTEDLLRKGKTQNYAPAFKKGKSSKKKKKSTKNKNSSKKMTKKQQNQQAAIDKYKNMIDQGYIIDLSVINDSQVATAVQNYMDYKDKVAELESQMIELENKWVDVWAEKTTAPSDEAVNRIDAYTKALGGLTDQMNALEASTTGGSTLAALDAIRGNKGRNYNVSGNDVLNAIRTGNAQKTAGAQYTLDQRRQAMQRAQGILSQFTAQYGARAESDNSKQGQAYRAILKQVQQAEEEYTNAALELAKQRVQEIKDNIDAIEDMYGAMSDWQSAVNGLRQSYINLNKARGNYENYTDYLVQAANAQKVLAIQQQESTRLHNEYVQAIAKGTLKQGTKEWYEMRAQILKVDQSIQDSKADIEELNKSARKAKLEQLYERAIEKADEFIDRLDMISSLISEEMKVNIDTGDLTDFGKLSIALDNQSMINAERDLNMYLKQREQIVTRMRAQGAGDQEINDYIAQNTSNLSNAISALQSARNSILSTIKSQAKAELDALQKTIDKRKEALQKKKDYYDYDKNQKKSVKEIALLQSQVRALQNVTDAQSKMRKARLEAQLQEQQEDLEQTRKEHVYQLQVEGLDDLSTQLSENYDKYVNELETNLDKMSQVINDAVEGTARSVTGVYNAMTSLLGEYGISGNDLKTVFGFSGDVVGSARDVISNPNGGYTQTTSQIISSEQSRAQNAKSSAQKASNQQQGAEQARIAQRQKQLAEEARKRAEEEARRKAEEARRAAEEEAARRKRAQLDANIASVQQNLANHQNALNQLLQAEKALEIKASKTKKKKKINQMMKQMEANMKQIYAYQQAIQTIQTQLSQLQAARGYASGVRRVNQDQTAWTNENWQKNGGQIIVRKSDGAILTPLKAGDGVIPADMTQKLFGLAQNYGSIMGGMDYSNVRPINQNQNITVTYGSLLTVNGNVDEKALPGLQEILRKSYAYTVKNLSADLKKGGLRTSIH